MSTINWTVTCNKSHLGIRDTTLDVEITLNGEYTVSYMMPKTYLKFIIGDSYCSKNSTLERVGETNTFRASFDWSTSADSNLEKFIANGYVVDNVIIEFECRISEYQSGTNFLYRRDVPVEWSVEHITTSQFTAKRAYLDSVSGDVIPSDEGEQLQIDIKGTYHGYETGCEKTAVLQYYNDDTDITEIDVSEHIPDILSENGCTFFVGTAVLSNGVGWNVNLILGVEDPDSTRKTTTTLTGTVSRAFANVHLSGAVDASGKQIGGVAFGKFSSVKSTDTQGKFECAYPAYFENGVYDGNGKPIGISLEPVYPSLITSSIAKSTVVTIYEYTAESSSWVFAQLRVVWASSSTGWRYVNMYSSESTGGIGNLSYRYGAQSNSDGSLSGFFYVPAGSKLVVTVYQNTSAALSLVTGSTKFMIFKMG